MEKIIFIILTIVNCFIGAIAAFLLKKSTKKLNKLWPIKIAIKNIIESKIIIGGIIYFITAIFAVLLLKKLEVMVFFPLTSTTYIFSFILANKYLHEKITLSKIIGICLIIVGVILIV